MPHRRRLVALVPLVIPLLLQAQAPAAGQGAKARAESVARHTPHEAAIRQWLDRWAVAFRARDVDAIMALYAPDVVAFDLVAPLQYEGREKYRKDYADFLAQYEGPLEVEMRDVHIDAHGDLAVLRALERIGGTLKGGQRTEFWMRATSVFRRVGGRWLDVHDHLSVPVDFETGKAQLALRP